MCKALPLPRAGVKLWCSPWGAEEGGDGAGLGEHSFSPVCIHRYPLVDPGGCCNCTQLLPRVCLFKQPPAPPFFLLCFCSKWTQVSRSSLAGMEQPCGTAPTASPGLKAMPSLVVAILQPRLDPVPCSLAWWAVASHSTTGALQSGTGLDFRLSAGRRTVCGTF